jgi:hypothetical protein
MRRGASESLLRCVAVFRQEARFVPPRANPPCAALIEAVRQNVSFSVSVVAGAYFGHFRQGARGLEQVGMKRASGM